MDWFLLVLAGLCEVIGVIGIGKINQEKNWKSIIFLLTGFIFSFVFLSIAMKTISMGTAYAVWTGIGTAGSAVAGMLLYGESVDWRRLLCIGMIITSVVGLKLIA